MVVAWLALQTGAAAATTVFSETFDAENGGATKLNHAAFSQFTVSDGTLDLIASGGYGLSCVGGTGSCIDLDGSTRNAGRLTSAPISFLSGVNYTLSFAISGNQRGGASDRLVFGVTGGFLADETINLSPGAGFQTIMRSFTGTSGTPASIFFDHAGGDNIGMILDNVTVTSSGPTPIPVPTALPLLVGALSGLVLLRRRWRV
jgi:hypothetical protein